MSKIGLSLAVVIAVASCAQPMYAAPDLPKPDVDLKDTTSKSRTAVFAAGCFWCVEAVFETLEGVTEVSSGYAGGTKESAVYDNVSSGDTEHAEAVRVTYEPSKISYGRLLQVLFLTHDPTTKDRQGPDWGRQYRSAIFFANLEEKRVAEAYIKQLDAAKTFSSPIVTTLEPLKEFYPAEAYHQDFVRLHPNHGYVQAWVPNKMKKLRDKLSDLLKK